jgi:hypothetical protein
MTEGAVRVASRTRAVAYRGQRVKTADLINVLAQDAPATWRLSGRLAMAFAVGAVIAAAIFASGVHPRPDLVAASHTARVLFKFLFALTLLSGAAGAVAQVGRPDAKSGPWALMLAAAPILLGLAVAAELLATPAQSWTTLVIGRYSMYCLTLIPAMALGPLACLLVALRESAPERPGLAGAVAGLAASGIAVTLYASHCTDDSPLFVAVWYSSAIAIVVAAGYLAGARLLKW